MITIQQDIKKVKKLLLDKKQKELRELSNLLTPEYNLRILEGLNPFERAEWMNVNRYSKN